MPSRPRPPATKSTLAAAGASAPPWAVPIFTDQEELLTLIEKCLLLFRAYGQPKERFADTITRLGFDQVQAMLLSDELLQRKEEILSQPAS